MPNNPAYSSRSGASQFMRFAQTMCRLVNTASPFIAARYPTRVALLAVLAAAETVCALLPAALQEQAAADAMSASQFNPTDATIIPGQDAP